MIEPVIPELKTEPFTAVPERRRPPTAAARTRPSTRNRLAQRWPWLLAAATSLIYSAIAVARYRRYEFSSFDLSIFTQAVASWAHGHLPVSTVRGGPGFSVLGDHFSPALAALAPAYRIAPTPITLLVAQAVLFGVSVVPIARLTERRLGRAAAVCVALAYVVSWGLQYAVVADFHEIALAVPLLAGGLCALVDRRWRAAVWWLLPLLLVKEDLGATLAAAGLCMIWLGGKKPGLVLAAAGVVGSALEVGVLIPWARSSGGYTYASSVTSGSVGHVLGSLFLPAEKLQTLLLLFGVAAFVCLRSSLSWLVVPTLGWRFASDTANYWGHEYHYNAVLMPIVFVALVDALSTLRPTRAGFVSHVPYVVTTIAVLSVHVTPLNRFLHADTWTSTARSTAADAAVALVPPGTTVETDIGLMSHLTAGRRTYFSGNNTRTVHPDYFVTDQAAWGQPMTGTTTLDYAHQLHPNQQFRIVFERDGITVLESIGRPAP